MECYVLLVLTLLCIYVTFSCGEETKEMTTISVQHLESQPKCVRCPDGTTCLAWNTCCPDVVPGRWGCCTYGRFAQCCPDRMTCCPQGYACLGRRDCVRMTYSSVLRVQAVLLVNSTDKHCRDGAAEMDPKASRNIPSRQVETALKRSGFIGASGDVFSPDEKYQCPDGTRICKLSSEIYRCCPIQNGRRRP